MSIDLKPCPFCGGVDISSGEVMGEKGDGRRFVRTACLSCGAEAGDANNDADADKKWNLRAKASDQPDDCRAAFEAYAKRECLSLEKNSEVMQIQGAPPHRNYSLWAAFHEGWHTRPMRESGGQMAREDLAYVHGAKAGWNAALSGDEESGHKHKRAMNNRMDLARKVLGESE